MLLVLDPFEQTDLEPGQWEAEPGGSAFYGTSRSHLLKTQGRGDDSAHGGRNMTTIEDLSAQTRATLARFHAALERHDVDGCIAEMAEDTVFENTSPAPDGERYEGVAALRQFFTRFSAENPRARFDIEEEFVAGARAIVRWRYDWGAGHVRGVDIMGFEMASSLKRSGT